MVFVSGIQVIYRAGTIVIQVVYSPPASSHRDEHSMSISDSVSTVISNVYLVYMLLGKEGGEGGTPWCRTMMCRLVKKGFLREDVGLRR